MKLNKSSPKEMFNNNQAWFDCVISGEDETTVDQFQITWQVNGTIQTNSKQGRSGGIKTSTMRLSLHESLSNVRCSASKDNVTVFEDLPPPKIGLLHRLIGITAANSLTCHIVCNSLNLSLSFRWKGAKSNSPHPPSGGHRCKPIRGHFGVSGLQ